MRLSFSNIAWEPAEDREVAEILASYSLSGIEIAPTKVWPELPCADRKSVDHYRSFWASQKLPIIGFQSLLFGHPELEIFNSPESREATFQYLSSVIELASQCGAYVLVFGSPRNRLVGDLSAVEALDIAISFFTEVGALAQSQQVLFCIEPNPAQYGCDFVRTASEGLDLVKKVNHPGFRLHLDAGAMMLNNEQFESVIESSIEYLSHFHISEPNLMPPGQNYGCHNRIANTLKKLDYKHYVSVEMLNKSNSPNPVKVRSVLDFVSSIYL